MPPSALRLAAPGENSDLEGGQAPIQEAILGNRAVSTSGSKKCQRCLDPFLRTKSVKGDDQVQVAVAVKVHVNVAVHAKVNVAVRA